MFLRHDSNSSDPRMCGLRKGRNRHEPQPRTCRERCPPSLVAGRSSASVLAISGNARAQDAADRELDEVLVLGSGETRQVQSIGAAQIDQLPAGTSPLKAIEKLPGVNFQSADPFGAYEWSTRITIRGFNQNRLGFTLDGVPLGDMTYGNHNGLHISRAISSELVGRVVLSQGTGALETASTSNLGGTVQFFSADPVRGLRADIQLTLRQRLDAPHFAQLESGELGAARACICGGTDATDKWKGDGDAEAGDYNFKIVQPHRRSEDLRVLQLLDRAENDYQDLSIDMVAPSRPSGTTTTPTGRGRCAPQPPVTRQARTMPSPATTPTGTPRACARTTWPTSR